MDALPVAAGAYLNGRLTPMIAKSLPDEWKSGWRNLVIATGAAGMTLFVPKYGSKLFVGSLTRVLISGVLPLLEKALNPPAPPPVPVISAATAQTITNAIAQGAPVPPAAVQALSDYEQATQMSDLPVEMADMDE